MEKEVVLCRVVKLSRYDCREIIRKIYTIRDENMNCRDIYNRYSYKSRITSSNYIDPEGFEYPRSIVACHNCMFGIGHSKCVLYKEIGESDKDIDSRTNTVHKEHYCQYFLIRDFGEGKDDEDEIARKAVMNIYNNLTNNKSSNSSYTKKSGCFVTTAVCDILGKDDKCFELEILRKFRDEELLTDKGLEKLVFEYYRISPRFVNKILTLEKNEEFAKFLLNEYINNIIESIQNGNKYKAIDLYQKMLHVIDIK